jgi:succinate dehydrogenase / fumarate reductase flavoprotein subunit
MQGLADGYFILPQTLGNYLTGIRPDSVDVDHRQFSAVQAEVRAGIERLLSVNGTRTVDSFHRELGRIMWEHCGMARNQAGLKGALELIPALRAEFWADVRVCSSSEKLNASLEKAGRVADFLEFAEIMCLDALRREESCGAHFREEYQTEDHEAKRDDERFMHVAAWEYRGRDMMPERHCEPLVYENVHPTQRSYR